MKSDVRRAGFGRARGDGRDSSAGASSLKELLLVVSLLLLASTPSSARQSDASRVQTPAPTVPVESAEWGRLIHPGEEFSVELPEKPFEHDTHRLVSGTLRDTEGMRVFGLYSGGVVFILATFDKPRDTETFDNFATYPWGGGALVGLAPKGNVTLQGFAGKEYEMEGGVGRARVFRTRKRAYLLWAMSREAGHPSVARFLNSLVLGVNPADTKIGEDSALAPAPTDRVGPGRGGMIGGGVGPGERAADAPSPNPDGPFKQNEVTRKVMIVYKAAPGFTEEARRNNVTGVVRLRAVFTSNGKVTNISVVKGLPDGLTEKAVAAARRMLFFPAHKDGREVSQYVILEYNFNIY